jgi:hypothetical protein
VVMYGGDDTTSRRAALEARITAQRLVQVFDDDGDGLVANGDLLTLESTLADADDVVTGILLNKGFSLEQLDILRVDRQVVLAWSGIAAQLAGERNTAFLDPQGRGPFDAFGVRGRSELGKLARGEIRSIKEVDDSGAGINQSIEGDIITRKWLFAPDPNDPNDPGPGGF